MIGVYMTLPQTVIKGAVKVQDVPQAACYDTFAQLLQDLGSYLTVEIPASSISNVVIGSQQPNVSDKGKLWVRLSNSGSFLGLYTYSGSTWNQVPAGAPGQVYWLIGDSANPPAGFQFIDNGDGTFTGPEYTLFIVNAIPNGSGGYIYYPAKWVGA